MILKQTLARACCLKTQNFKAYQNLHNTLKIEMMADPKDLN